MRTHHPPTSDDVRARLEPLTIVQLKQLAKASGVPFTTLYKIQRGETQNPGIDTVGSFWGCLPRRRRAQGPAK